MRDCQESGKKMGGWMTTMFKSSLDWNGKPIAHEDISVFGT